MTGGARAVRLLVVSGSSDDKIELLLSCLKPYDATCVHLGLELSRHLTSIPQSRRAMRTIEFLKGLPGEGIIFFTDIDILFDSEMDIAPLEAFASIAKNRPVCVDWPGAFDFSSRRLSYAETDDPAYREFTLPSQVCALDVSGTAYPEINP